LGAWVEPSDSDLETVERKLIKLQSKLTEEQRETIANVAMWNFIPNSFYSSRLHLRMLPEDERERSAAFEVLAGVGDQERGGLSYVYDGGCKGDRIPAAGHGGAFPALYPRKTPIPRSSFNLSIVSRRCSGVCRSGLRTLWSEPSRVR
jgi:hypothetical protein